jgi:hypothetical protein
MWVNLGFKLSFFKILILICLIFSGTYFIYSKLIEFYNPLNNELKADIISSSKNNNEKSESSAETFLRNNRESFLRNKL